MNRFAHNLRIFERTRQGPPRHGLSARVFASKSRAGILRRGKHSSGGERGAFTLLEMILALAIVATIAITLSTAMQIAYRSKSAAENIVEPGRTIAVTMEFIATDLQNAMPPTGVLASSFEGVTGQGDLGSDGDDLIFFSTADGPTHESGNSEIKQIELVVLAATNGDHVLLRRVTNLVTPLVQNVPDPDEEVLCRGVVAFNLRYYDGSVWQPTWDSTQLQNQLPLAVEVTLGLARPGANGQVQVQRYVRTFGIPASTIANTGSGLNGGLSQ